jgi:hypothetical protein
MKQKDPQISQMTQIGSRSEATMRLQAKIQ